MSAAVTTEPIPIPTPPLPPTKVLTFYERAADGTFELTFQWTKQMPKKGYLGTVTFRQFQKKPIQVFDAEPVYVHGFLLGWDWAYQAQDGSFLCRMFVSNFGNVFITFSERKKGDWPLITLLAPHHAALADAGDPDSNQVT